MAQFDVFRNPGQTKVAIPFVVAVQSAVHDAHGRCVAVPLVRKDDRDVPVYARRMNPGFIVAGVSVVLHPLDIATLPMEKLGPPVASLASCGDDIIAALDEVFTRAYG